MITVTINRSICCRTRVKTSSLRSYASRGIYCVDNSFDNSLWPLMPSIIINCFTSVGLSALCHAVFALWYCTHPLAKVTFQFGSLHCKIHRKLHTRPVVWKEFGLLDTDMDLLNSLDEISEGFWPQRIMCGYACELCFIVDRTIKTTTASLMTTQDRE